MLLTLGWDNSNVSYLPERFRKEGEILWETPEEGFVYQWVEISPPIWEQIQGLQNPPIISD